MKRIKFIAFAWLISMVVFAQKTQTINNPSYEFQNSGIRNISKIELSPKETRIYIYNTFLPNWWEMFSDKETIVDCDTKIEYKVKGIEGAKFNEKLWMPSSGDSTIVLIFPPLDKKVKRIDYGNNIFGISLDPEKAGLKPNYSVPLEINDWLNKEIDLCTKEPIKDFKSENFFSNEDAKIVGYIKGYSSKSDVKTGIIYMSNFLTGEDYPRVVEVYEDGRFEVTLPMTSPLYTYMQIGNQGINFYLEPDQTLGIIVDWDDYLTADRLRNQRYVCKKTSFKGKLANINTQLLQFDFEKMNYGKFRKMQDKMTFDEKVDFYNKQKDMEMAKLEYYNQMWPLNQNKSYPILKNKIILDHAQELLSLEMHRSYDARKDTANKELQKPLPDSFYSFLKDVPMNDLSLLVNDNFKTFINRFEFCDLISNKRKEAFKHGSGAKSPFEILLENEKDISKKDKELLTLITKKDKSDDEVKKLKEMDMNKTFKTFKEKYPKSMSIWEKEMSISGLKTDLTVWNLFEKDLKEKFEIERNLCLDIAKIRTLDFKFKRMDSENAKLFWDELKSNIETPYLKTTGENLYNKRFSSDTNLAYELPEGKATDIFNKIIAPHKGKILFVDFWATTCGPCLGGIKSMKETRKEYADSEDIDFVFITSERNSPEKNYNDFIKDQELKNTYRVSESDYLYLRQLFKFNGIPRYAVIDKDGKVLNDDFEMYNFKSELAKILDSKDTDTAKK